MAEGDHVILLVSDQSHLALGAVGACFVKRFSLILPDRARLRDVRAADPRAFVADRGRCVPRVMSTPLTSVFPASVWLGIVAGVAEFPGVAPAEADPLEVPLADFCSFRFGVQSDVSLWARQFGRLLWSHNDVRFVFLPEERFGGRQARSPRSARDGDKNKRSRRPSDNATQ